MVYRIFFLLILGVSIQCIQFKVDNLKPDLLAKIPIGSETTLLQAKIVNNVLTNLPMYPPVLSGNIYLVDVEHSWIKIFNSQGNLETIIGNLDQELPTSVNQYKYKFGSIGQISVDSSRNLYVQNRFGSRDALDGSKDQDNLFKKYSGSFDPNPSAPLPSYIIKLSPKGVSKSILGASGRNSEPFRYIEFIRAVDEDEVFVYHRMGEEMRLSYYKNEVLESEIRESNLDVFRSQETNFNLKLDQIQPSPGGQYALASISFYNKGDNRFKFRRIYKIDFATPGTSKMIKEIQDPSEILFSVRENDEFYIWETEDKGNSIRLQVHDPEGNHINNKRLEFLSPRGQWRETYTDPDDNLFSVRIRQGFFEVYRWR
jgi:hypothetical protein